MCTHPRGCGHPNGPYTDEVSGNTVPVHGKIHIVIISIIQFIFTCDKPDNNKAKYRKFLVIHGLKDISMH